MVSTAEIPILGFVGFSGTGKTTLLLKILPLLKSRGVRVGMIKHAHHQFEIDHPEKDSYRLRKEGGVSQMLVASRQRWVLMTETGEFDEPYLDGLLPQFDQSILDLILVEGFKHEEFPKLEVHRPSLGRRLLCLEDENIIAVASGAPLNEKSDLPLLNMNDPEQITQFIIDELIGVSL
jgi:molybdopterin-guanine dinucleotide biosynthesis protein MobB